MGATCNESMLCPSCWPAANGLCYGVVDVWRQQLQIFGNVQSASLHWLLMQLQLLQSQLLQYLLAMLDPG